MSLSFCKIPVDLVIRLGDKLPCDIYLRLSETKIIKLSKKDDINSMLKKYKKKGIKEVYASKKEFESFIKFMQSKYNSKFFKPSQGEDASVFGKHLEQAYEVVKESLVHLGVNKTTVAFTKQIAESSLALMEKVPSIFSFFKKLADECDKEFLRIQLTGFIASCMIDEFGWSSKQIKEKLFLVSFLCGLTLNREDFNQLLQWERGELSIDNLDTNIIDHPIRIINMLKGRAGEVFGNDIIAILEQHHERPDGSGFPYGTKPEKMILLSCVYIVARSFAIHLEKSDFQSGKMTEILYLVSGEFKTGNYKKASNALNLMFAA